MTDLDEAVSELVDPVSTRIPRGDGLPDHITVDPCLLDQLEAAIASTIGGQGNTASAKNTRNVLNSDALYHFTIISGMIGDWCRIASIRPPKPAKAALIAFAEAKPDAGEFYTRKMRAWAELIRTTLSPGKRIQVMEPCPECNSDEYEAEDGGMLRHPVWVEYQQDNPLGTVLAKCLACTYEWGGVMAIRALRFELG